jgi:phosphomannomutase
MVRKLIDESPGSIDGVNIEEIQTLDGVKYYLDDGSWLLIRPSGTEPVLRVYAEAREQERVKKLLEFGQSVAAGA